MFGDNRGQNERRAKLKSNTFTDESLEVLKTIPQLFSVDSNYLIWKIKTLIYPYKDHEYIPQKQETSAKFSTNDPPLLSYPEFFLPLLGYLAFNFVATLIHISDVNEYEPSKKSIDFAFSLFVKNLFLVILEGLLIKTFLMLSTGQFIYLVNTMTYSGNKFILLSLCGLFYKVKVLLFSASIYCLVTNCFVIQRCFRTTYRTKSVDIIISLLNLIANLIGIVDIIL